MHIYRHCSADFAAMMPAIYRGRVLVASSSSWSSNVVVVVVVTSSNVVNRRGRHRQSSPLWSSPSVWRHRRRRQRSSSSSYRDGKPYIRHYQASVRSKSSGRRLPVAVIAAFGHDLPYSARSPANCPPAAPLSNGCRASGSPHQEILSLFIAATAPFEHT